MIQRWYVYIARARTGFYYTGITTDLDRRMIKHNSGRGSQMARQQGPFVPIYQSQPFATKSEARAREAQIKRWSRTKKDKLITGEWK